MADYRRPQPHWIVGGRWGVALSNRSRGRRILHSTPRAEASDQQTAHAPHRDEAHVVVQLPRSPVYTKWHLLSTLFENTGVVVQTAESATPLVAPLAVAASRASETGEFLS